MTVRHVVLSAAAVFLALAAGLVLGARVLPGAVTAGGDGGLQQRLEAADAENEELTQRLSAADDFDVRMSARIVRDALNGRSVVIFHAPDAADSDVEEVRGTLVQAGATVTGTVALTDEFVDANSAEKLRSVVNSPIVPAGKALDTALLDPSAQAGDLLGIALLINRDPKVPPVDDAARETVLTTLRDTGFLRYEDTVPAANAAVIVTGGAVADDAGNRGATVARFADGLAPHGSGTVLAGADGSATGVAAVAVTRADPALSDAVSTVDDIGAAAGRITTVLALQAMAGGAPPGQYGVGPGATAVTVG